MDVKQLWPVLRISAARFSRRAGGRAALVIVSLGSFSFGCTATVTPPLHPVHPVAVFVADYGRHSSVFLPVKKVAYIEYSFGDWNFYALSHTSLRDGFAALFYSDASAFGRRFIARSVDQNEPVPYGSPRMISICVSSDDVERVRNQLETRWQVHLPTRIFNPYADTDFVKDDRPYGWRTDCNEVTAAILRDLGCEVEGATYLSHFRLSEDASGRMDYWD